MTPGWRKAEKGKLCSEIAENVNKVISLILGIGNGLESSIGGLMEVRIQETIKLSLFPFPKLC